MSIHALYAVSPIDGRYASRTKDLQNYFSEAALMHYRVRIEIEYFIALCQTEIKPLKKLTSSRFPISVMFIKTSHRKIR